VRYGIVSDVHANIQAWKAVLRDMKREGVDVILCLGDVIGYGPNPAEVLDSCYSSVDYFILGNHDAVIGNRLDSNLFNDNAKYLIEWTRDQLNDAAAGFFADMPLRMEGEGFVCAHGELAMPGRFSYIYEAKDAIESFTSNDSPLMFVGHTHLPAKIAFNLATNQVNDQVVADGYLKQDERYLINVGSVGDPRDGQTTASYCIYDADKKHLRYRQVPFDVAAFRKSLLKVQLPVTPFFLQVYDGKKAERETIKDMEVMGVNQALEVKSNTQKISNIPDEIQKRRTKVTFSMETVEQTKQYKARENDRKVREETSKKKNGKVIAGALAGLFLVLIIVIIVIKSKSGGSDNGHVEKPDNFPSQVVVEVQPAGEFHFKLEDAVLSKGLKIEDGHVNWESSDEEINWKFKVEKKGYYQVLMNHSKASGESKVNFSVGSQMFSAELKKIKALPKRC
jgi:predicted phosphodiesterase